MIPRAEVYKAIDSERAYQLATWTYGGGEDNPLEIGEFLTLLSAYLHKAQAEWVMEGEKAAPITMEFIRKIAGIAVNCMEQHGAPMRERIV